MPKSQDQRPLVLNVGITGHRAKVLPATLVRTLRPVVYTVFSELRDATLKLRELEAEFCSFKEARLHLHTALASGSDQIAAICARSSGFFVRAILPFEPSEYRKDFPVSEELDQFEQALAAADEIIALPGERSNLEGAYVLVAEALVRDADIVIAIWDGERGKGPGGTAHVVELALLSSTPVIHIDIDHGSEKVRIRALLGGDPTSPFSTSIRDPNFYSEVLRCAFNSLPMPVMGRGNCSTAGER